MNALGTKLRFHCKKTLPVILQDEVAECGLTCVAMICHYLGHEIDLHFLRMMENTSTRGATLVDLMQICENLQLKTRALRVELEELHLVKTPAILHWNMNHFVVLKEIRKNKIIIHDPASGLRKCNLKEVSDSFTGVVLEVDKADNFEAVRLKKKLSLSSLFKESQGVFNSLFVLFILSIVIEVFTLINPLFLQYVTDSVVSVGAVQNLYVMAAGFILLAIFQFVTEFTRSNAVIFITNHLSEQFSANVVKHILKLPLDYFEKRHKGDIQSRFQSINHIQRQISTEFINTILDGFMIAVTILVMLIYSPRLTIIVCISLAIYIMSRCISYHSLKKQTEASLNAQAKSSSLFLETLTAMLPIKSYGKEAIRFNCWHNSYVAALNSEIGIAKINVKYSTLNQLLLNLDQIIVICVGAGLIVGNFFSIGMLMAFLAYRSQLVTKASSFVQKIFDYKLISVHLARLGDILFQCPEEITHSSVSSNTVQGKVQIKDLSFQYDGSDKPVFKNLNMTINPGEKVAITGPSGCGKTTLLKVIMRLLKKTEGEIFIDELPASQFGIKKFREITASVMQDDVLMSGSILQNICFFEDRIDLARVYECTQIAEVHATILSMPMGYETLVGELGSSLSGGQKQRILLARALYKRPKILFLDEATSHLDVDNELKINKALKELSITQIVVAHREETIKMADRVINLK